LSAVLAPITKEVLVWARKASLRSEHELAQVADVSVERYREWESGVSFPTLRQIEKIANKVKRPCIVFFMPEPPTEPKALTDYRTVGNKVKGQFSPELVLEIRRARYLQSRLEEDWEEVFPDWASNLPAYQLGDDPVRRAEDMRTALGVTLAQQKKFKLENRGIREWRHALFLMGVLTFGFRVEREQALGFAIWHAQFPLVGFNLEGYKSQQVFTLFHELAHLCLRQSVVSDLGADRIQVGRDVVRKTETFCNRFASALLLPPGAKEVQDAVADISKEGATDASLVDKYAKKFRVSKYVLLHRLIESGKVPKTKSSAVFTAWRKIDEDEAERKDSKQRAKAERDKLLGKERRGASPVAESLTARGETLTRQVLRAMSSGSLDSSDAQDLLGLRDFQFEALEQELSRRKVVD
jgi:Zn-dependent peptidase ImmA (M78 family)/transcriptional regulator with XRE-family HTH domain